MPGRPVTTPPSASAVDDAVAGDIIVLKFGGSILRTEHDARIATHEIYRWLRDGWRVIAVVSALEGQTDALLARAGAWTGPLPTPPAEPGVGAASAMAALVATGEAQSAAILALALDRAGIPAEVLDAAAIGLRTSGPPLDAAPVGLDAGALRAALRRTPVVVIPGFTGRDEHGHATLLGRGGSDLSALAIAHFLGGARCRLVKDVDGLYDRDPADGPDRRPAARRFDTLSWDDALALDGTIVQHKAIGFARRHDLPFEVGAPLATGASRVGDLPARFDAPAREPHPARVPSAPRRIALLGAGSIGLGVYHALRALPRWFDVVGVFVRDVEKAAAGGVDPDLLTSHPGAIELLDADIVVELLGGFEPAHSLIAAALERGQDVVTANKAIIAREGPRLEALALRRNAAVRYAAAVGGAIPCVETVARLARGPGITSIEGVLNGTSNFVLERLARGRDLDLAVRAAQQAGLAEADPSRDLDGRDAADKLAILARLAFGVPVDPVHIARQEIDARPSTSPPGEPAPSSVRQVARARLEADGRVVASVRLEPVPPDSPLARARAEANALVLTTRDGPRVALHGKGAGRWPTAEAVVGDLLQLARERMIAGAAGAGPQPPATEIEALTPRAARIAPCPEGASHVA